MPATVKLAPGRYRLTTSSPTTVVYYDVDDTGIRSTFGILEWVDDPDGGHYQRGDIAVAPSADGSFVAVHGSESYSGTWLRVA